MLRNIVLQFFEIICHILPVSNKKVFFNSFHGQYNDNPKYISEKLHELHPSWNFYWEFSEKSKDNDFPPYVQKVKTGSFKLIYFKNRCRIIVENGAGYYLAHADNKFGHLFKKLLKNKKQFELSTWHGNPIKHIGAQIPGNENWTKNNVFSSSDLLVAGCEVVQHIFEKAFLGLMPVTLQGTPRTDILFDKAESRKQDIKKKLSLPLEKKIILYAPTYRYSAIDSGIAQLQMIDIPKLLASLKGRFSGEWVFVMRVHNLVLLEIEKSGMLEKYAGTLFNGNLFDDMNEYLCAADVLLTDYSGCIYDVALTDKPCFLFAHDKENYVSRERGTYMPISMFPYSFSETFDELLSNIQQYDEKKNKEDVANFLHTIGNAEDGKASDRLVSIIEKRLKA
jgi:CDP-glycerol glycerophosphotransferase